MKLLGVYCERGDHAQCPRARSCRCECHDYDGEGDDVKTEVTYRCDEVGCPFTTTHATALASHKRAAHEDVVRTAPNVTSPAAALGSALDRTVPPASNGNGTLVWEDPPGRGDQSVLVQRVRPCVPELKRHPGKWARVVDYPKSKTSANAARAKLLVVFPDLEFKACVWNGGSAVYARAREDAE